MQIVQSITYPKQLVNCFQDQNGLVVGQWGGNVTFRENDKLSTKMNIQCLGLFQFQNQCYLAITSKNTLVSINKEKNMETLDQSDSPYLICSYYQKTSLFMHNTIQQQKYLCLWNLKTQQRQRYLHIDDITSLCATDDGIWFGDKQGYLNFISDQMKLQKRVKMFANEISQISVVQKKVYCSSRNSLKAFYKNQIISYSLFDHEISCMGVRGNQLLLGTVAGELLVQESMKEFKKHEVHTSSIMSISLYGNQIVTSSSDRTVKIIVIE